MVNLKKIALFNDKMKSKIKLETKLVQLDIPSEGKTLNILLSLDLR